ncbi:MAG: ATP-binding cassette domain-containing protein [Clostridia bacterium]|nr:ATP-binding cassette domain-containing protein [Clostridia bacterium]
MIELRNIALGFEDRMLFRGGEMDLRGVWPLLGLNGSGKTTLLRMLAGFLPPLEGVFSVRGRILYQPQKPLLFSMSALENAMLGMVRKDEQKALQMLAEMGLADFARTKAKTLSGGEQARLCLCRSLLAGGDVVLMDEPFAAVDAASVDRLALYLKDFCVGAGATLLVAVHSVHTAALFSEQCLLIRDEKLVTCETEKAREYLVSSI